ACGRGRQPHHFAQARRCARFQRGDYPGAVPRAGVVTTWISRSARGEHEAFVYKIIRRDLRDSSWLRDKSLHTAVRGVEAAGTSSGRPRSNRAYAAVNSTPYSRITA